MNPEISIIIPVYNDAPVLPLLLQRLAAVVAALDARCEVVCVDDGSRDGSFELLCQLQKENPFLHLLKLTTNVGQSNAITAGIDYASGDRLVVMDSDLEDPPEAIPYLLKALEAAPLALAQDCTRWEKGLRGISSLFFCLLTRLLTALAPPANVGVFRAFTRQALEQALDNSPPWGTTLSRFYAAHIPYTLVAITRQKRQAGTSGYTFFKRMNLAITRIRTYHRISFLRKPHRPHYEVAELITP